MKHKLFPLVKRHIPCGRLLNGPIAGLPRKLDNGYNIYIYISHKTTRVVKTCPPCMFDELEDIILYLEKWLFDVTYDVTTP